MKNSNVIPFEATAVKSYEPGDPVAVVPTDVPLSIALIDNECRVVYSSDTFANTLLQQPTSSETDDFLPDCLARHYTPADNASFDNLSSTLVSQPAAQNLVLQDKTCGRLCNLSITALENQHRFVVITVKEPLRNPANESSISRGPTERVEQDTDYPPAAGVSKRGQLQELIDNWSPEHKSDCLAVLIFDLDKFRQINDTLGHAIGDTLIKLVSRRILRSLQESDVLVELGGDDFALVLQYGKQPEYAEKIATKLVELIGRPFLASGQQINISASVGIALLDETRENKADLVRHAELALYTVKSSGGAAFRFFETEMESCAQQQRSLEIALRRAMGLNEFRLVYQPQVDTKTRVVTGFEALIRWNSAELGVVSPVDFIPIAEKTGEIKSIGTWVINEACRQAMTWPEHLTVAVNVSPLQFDGHSFISVVEKALAKSGLHPNRLEIEITEGLLIDRPEEALSLLSSIREMGVKVAMDDFGTGYSSLSYLKSFPFTKLKIDQIFVRGEQNSKSQALVEAILTLGKRLGMTTIAEGVETEAQYRHLADSGCAGAQGYLISKPIAADAVGKFIEKHNPQWSEGDKDD